jgi:hypothetical protein
MSQPRKPQEYLQLTTPLLNWLEEDASWDRLPTLVKARIHWSSRIATLNAAMSHQLVDRESYAEHTTFSAPLFIVGPWRSGTTAMHDLLVAATGGSAPQTWQCMNAASFMITGRPKKSRTTKRPMDELVVTSESPQEDEFAILTLGEASAYRALLMPHRISSLKYTLDQEYWLREPSWLFSWTRFLGGVLQSLDTSPQPLILKSPGHTFRLKAILRHFPRSRIVWMVRDPTEVFESNQRMWRAMFEKYALTDWDEGELDEFLRNVLQQTASTLRWCVSTIPENQLKVVELRQLKENPSLAVDEVVRHFSLHA